MTEAATIGPTPGPWNVCNNGECPCLTVSWSDGPVARVVQGEWGDDYPAIRLVGDSSLDYKAEAYMERIPYGKVDVAVAKANAHLIAAAPELLEALRYARRWLRQPEHDTEYVDKIISKAQGA